MSSQTLLSAKGQVVIPKRVRDAHAWAPGTVFEVVDRPDGVLLRTIVPAFAAASLDALRGFAPATPAQPVERISGLDDAALAKLLADD